MSSALRAEGQPLHRRILIGLVAGGVLGLAARSLLPGTSALDRLVSVIEPIGRLWLSALVMVVIPLILATLSVGIAGLGSLRRVGRIGGWSAACFGLLTALSTGLGLVVMNLAQPGLAVAPELRARLLADYGAAAEARSAAPAPALDLLLRIVPRNPLKAAVDGEMLGVIFFAVMLGLALASLPPERAAPLRRVLESLADACVAMIGLVMGLAPWGVLCLIFSVTARFGDGLLWALAAYVATVLGSLLAFQVVGYGLVLKLVARRSPLEFFRQIQVVMLTAFATSSSNATLPTSLRTARDELGLPPEVSSFVLPLGATLNMNGTALFEGATVLFLAQVFGVALSLEQQLLVVVLSVLTAVGTAGVPGGSIPLLVTVLSAVGVPAEGIAIVLGVDRILDMGRTVLNVTGDLVTTCVVARLVAPGGAEEASATAGAPAAGPVEARSEA